jgi:hypothetical protein
MKAQPSSRPGDQWQDAPSLTVSFVFVVLTVGLVALASAVVAAPGLVAAFFAGVATAIVVTFVQKARAGDRHTRSLANAAPARR